MNILILLISILIILIPIYLLWKGLDYYDVHYNPKNEYMRKAVREMVTKWYAVYKKGKRLETDYEKWKARKKLFKASWVIKYYESITDFNQYKLGKSVTNRAILIMGVFGAIVGFGYGSLIFG